MSVVAEYRISFLDYAARLARSRGVRRLAAQRRRREAPRIACFADDDIGAQILAHGWYEDLLLRALFEVFLRDRAAAFRDGAAVDVGANVGNHTLWFARRFARVVAVEPNPICTHLLQASLLMNGVDNVHLLALGLSDAAGERTFHADLQGNLGPLGPDRGTRRIGDAQLPGHGRARRRRARRGGPDRAAAAVDQARHRGP
ncbi:FkbM family methyltransferase [Tahibacter sp. UC22_41]|uniref:FkbM family methyltransferase n=1 Tax=Tahibacter sp. UC22_41 TaxID=3350178 RepID=UPI0036DF6EAC